MTGTRPLQSPVTDQQNIQTEAVEVMVVLRWHLVISRARDKDADVVDDFDGVAHAVYLPT